MSAPSDPLAGKVAIVTGAGRGAGAAAALALARAGVSVCASDINPDRAGRVAQDILAAGGAAFGWQADISNKFQVASLIETTRDRFNRLDILVQHAHINPPRGGVETDSSSTPPSGVIPPRDALTLDEWEWRRIVEVNLTGSFFCMQLAARVMADEGGGSIALLVRPVAPGLTAAYAASQAGMSALAGALAAEWAEKGVHVAGIDATDPDEAVRALLEMCGNK